jgi:predicted RNA binding protein with dsRBD fold (UPF0201 family)
LLPNISSDPEFNIKKFHLTVHTPLLNSESEIKVKKSLNNIFPTINFTKIADDQFQGHSHNISDMNTFFTLIYEQKILDAARNYVLSNLDPRANLPQKTRNISILINKQIAFYKKINFCSDDESPLGAIYIELELDSDDLERFIDKLFPKFEWISQQH